MNDTRSGVLPLAAPNTVAFASAAGPVPCGTATFAFGFGRAAWAAAPAGAAANSSEPAAPWPSHGTSTWILLGPRDAVDGEPAVTPKPAAQPGRMAPARRRNRETAESGQTLGDQQGEAQEIAIFVAKLSPGQTGQLAASMASTSSCSRPFVETALPPSGAALPDRSVKLPPASSTITWRAARSQSDTAGSAAISAAPSATSM